MSGAFLEFFEERGGLKIFGYPLTREFMEDGRKVQYFQHVRMEEHPENPDPYKVQLGLLGDELGFREPPISPSQIPPAGHPNKRYFPETGHTVALAFLAFYDNNGGLDVFGYPITEWGIEPNGRFVQYFQRGKMEWYPENPQGQRVQLGMLGTIYAEQFVESRHKEPDDPKAYSQTPDQDPSPEAEPTAVDGVSDIKTMATVQHPLIGVNTWQVIYVYVFDQFNDGVAGASIEIEVQYSDGERVQPSLPMTNADGFSRAEFLVETPRSGHKVIVNLFARYGELTAQTSTSFLPWW